MPAVEEDEVRAAAAAVHRHRGARVRPVAHVSDSGPHALGEESSSARRARGRRRRGTRAPGARRRSRPARRSDRPARPARRRARARRAMEAGALWPDSQHADVVAKRRAPAASARPRAWQSRASSARPARSSSGGRLIGCQAAPNSTVRRSAARLWPPTQIGGCGFCTGLGSKMSPLNCVYLPANDGAAAGPQLLHRLAGTRRSWRRARRTARRASALSAATQPAPMPSTTRPPLSASSEETILAVTTALRYGHDEHRGAEPHPAGRPGHARPSVTSGSKTVSPKFTTLACGTTT